MPILKYRPSVGAPWQVVGITGPTFCPQIVVTAPTGSTVTCTKGATVLNAEEVEGTWTFNVPEYGTWDVVIDGEVESIIVVDAVKRYTHTTLPQLINYTMLYDYGNECTAVTGGWGKNLTGAMDSVSDTGSYTSAGIATSTVTKNEDHLSAYLGMSSSNTGTYYGYLALGCVNPIDFSQYTGAFTKSRSEALILSSTYASVNFQPLNQWTDYIETVGSPTITETVKYYDVDLTTQAQPYFNLRCIRSDSKYLKFDLYSAALFKTDDLSQLSSFISDTELTMEELLNRSNELLNNNKAVFYILRQCTGNFMGSAITSEIFMSELDNSPYKDRFYANEHWAKFLAMVK